MLCGPPRSRRHQSISRVRGRSFVKGVPTGIAPTVTGQTSNIGQKMEWHLAKKTDAKLSTILGLRGQS